MKLSLLHHCGRGPLTSSLEVIKKSQTEVWDGPPPPWWYVLKHSIEKLHLIGAFNKAME